MVILEVGIRVTTDRAEKAARNLVKLLQVGAVPLLRVVAALGPAAVVLHPAAAVAAALHRAEVAPVPIIVGLVQAMVLVRVQAVTTAAIQEMIKTLQVGHCSALLQPLTYPVQLIAGALETPAVHLRIPHRAHRPRVFKGQVPPTLGLGLSVPQLLQGRERQLNLLVPGPCQTIHLRLLIRQALSLQYPPAYPIPQLNPIILGILRLQGTVVQ